MTDDWVRESIIACCAALPTFSEDSTIRKLLKFDLGRKEHGEDLSRLNVPAEALAECDDLFNYGVLLHLQGRLSYVCLLSLLTKVGEVEKLLEGCVKDAPAEA
jgi:hypothetical protein